MKAPFKEYWYDWFGFNTDLFHWVYGRGTERLADILPLLDFLGEHKNFHYLLLFFAGLFALKYLYRKALGYDTSGYLFRVYGMVMCVLVASFFALAVVITGMKELFGFMRPYAGIDGIELLYGVPDAKDALRSFPSGHVAFTALWGSLLWSQLWGFLRPALLVILVLMCWFRIAIGAHYPMDVVTSIVIVRLIVSGFQMVFAKVFKVRKQ